MVQKFYVILSDLEASGKQIVNKSIEELSDILKITLV